MTTRPSTGGYLFVLRQPRPPSAPPDNRSRTLSPTPPMPSASAASRSRPQTAQLRPVAAVPLLGYGASQATAAMAAAPPATPCPPEFGPGGAHDGTSPYAALLKRRGRPHSAARHRTEAVVRPTLSAASLQRLRESSSHDNLATAARQRGLDVGEVLESLRKARQAAGAPRAIVAWKSVSLDVKDRYRELDMWAPNAKGEAAAASEGNSDAPPEIKALVEQLLATNSATRRRQGDDDDAAGGDESPLSVSSGDDAEGHADGGAARGGKVALVPPKWKPVDIEKKLAFRQQDLWTADNSATQTAQSAAVPAEVRALVERLLASSPAAAAPPKVGSAAEPMKAQGDDSPLSVDSGDDENDATSRLAHGPDTQESLPPPLAPITSVPNMVAVGSTSTGEHSTTSSGGHSTTSANTNANLKGLVKAAQVAVAAARLQRLMPHIDVQQLLDNRHIPIDRVDDILARVTRFVLRVRGLLIRRTIAKRRIVRDPFGDWQRFSVGDNALVIDSVSLRSAQVKAVSDSDATTNAPPEVLLHVSRVDFTLSAIRLVHQGGDLTNIQLSSVVDIDAQQGGLTLSLANPPRSLTFAEVDSPQLLAVLAARMSQRLSRAVSLVNRVVKRSVTILHFNDVYHLESHKSSPNSLTGGAARFMTKVREIQGRTNPLILFSGDFMSPSLMSVMLLGRQMVDAFNLLGVHVGTFGNHEFDYGLEALESAIHGSTHGNVIFAGSNTQWVMSNMSDAKTGRPLGNVNRSVMLTWNHVRIGILGLSENWLPSCAQIPKGSATYDDVFEAGERMARELKANGAELVIALTHSRYSTDCTMGQRCPSIDLILGGHDHFFRNSPTHRVVKSGEEFNYLSEIDITVGSMEPLSSSSSSDGEATKIRYRVDVHPITSKIPEHPAMVSLIARYEARLRSKMGKVVAVSSVPLDSTEEACRYREGLLSGFIVDVMAKRTNADFAVLGGAAIAGKNVLPPGDVTVGDVFNWFPNDTRSMVVQLLGSSVIKLLNIMVADVPNEAPSFPHPSANLTFTINTMRTPTTVQDVCVRGEPIDEDEWYVVAVEDYVGMGKGKYKFVPQEGDVITEEECAEQITYWILDYFESSMKNAADRRKTNMLKLRTAVRAKADFARAASFANSGDSTSIRGALLLAKSEAAASVSIATLADAGDLLDNVASPVMDSSLSRRLTTSAGGGAFPDSGSAAAALADMHSEIQKLLAVPAFETDVVVARASKSLAALLDCDYVRIVLRDLVTNTYWCRPRNATGRRLATQNPEGFLQRVLETRAAFFVNEVPSELMLDQALELDPASETNSMACFPLARPKRDGGGLGDILAVVEGVNSQRKGGFSHSDLRVGSMYCAVLAVVLDAVRLQSHSDVAEVRHRMMIEAASSLVTPVTQLGAKAAANTTLIGKIYEIVKHAKQLFAVKKAFFFVHDEAAGEVWTAKRKNETDQIIRLRTEEAKVVGQVVAAKGILRVDVEISRMTLSRSDFSNNDADSGVLGVPVFSPDGPKGKVVLGVLLMSHKLNGSNFSTTDEAIAASFVPFAAICVSNCIEMDALRTGVKRDELPAFPVHELGRIQFKRGWGAVRSRLAYITSGIFKAKLENADLAAAMGHSANLHTPSDALELPQL